MKNKFAFYASIALGILIGLCFGVLIFSDELCIGGKIWLLALIVIASFELKIQYQEFKEDNE